MSLLEKKARLKWNSRRGMLELDLILGRFVDKYLDLLDGSQLDSYDYLLSQSDPDLYSWFMGYEQPSDKTCADIINFIKLHDKV